MNFFYAKFAKKLEKYKFFFRTLANSDGILGYSLT